MNCTIFRCKRQDQMYLYLRADLAVEALPEPLRRLTGALIEVMRLELTPQRRLARADINKVLAGLESEGFFLQMPPNGQIRAQMNDAD
jgi:uncharacterized protein YcgL (UPF0745 family)